MFGFVGPNGAGKTTAMRIILGALEPDAGQVRWRGQPITDEMSKRVGQMVGTTDKRYFQQFACASQRAV
jgi:ABC-2 type transport system ATP-binding protein